MRTNFPRPLLLKRGGIEQKISIAFKTLSAPRKCSGHLPQDGEKKKALVALSAFRQAQDTQQKKVLIALSGGIDSAVSAHLLIKQGYKVEAAFMKNWSSTKGLVKNECPWLEDRREALRVAAFLGIKLHTLDFEKEYQKNVMNYFFREYKAGRTPNPDVMCNKEIKFKLLYNWAMKNGFDFLATGHYARISSKYQVVSSKRPTPNPSPIVGREGLPAGRQGEVVYSLVRSADEFKDQTYFIYNIKAEQLPHLLFPIGGMKKSAVRSLAKKIGLPNAEKKESMGLCFVGKVRLKEFLGQKFKLKKGNIVGIPPLHPPLGKGGNLSFHLPFEKGGRGGVAKILGQHEGLFNYTIGQRQGLKIGGIGPFFVYKKDLATNTLYVTNDPEDKRLFVKEVQVHSFNWISPLSLNPSPSRGEGRVRVVGRYRHQGELIPLTIKKIKKNLYQVKFQHAQKAIASGQSLVLYKGKECVGGGVIG